MTLIYTIINFPQMEHLPSSSIQVMFPHLVFTVSCVYFPIFDRSNIFKCRLGPKHTCIFWQAEDPLLCPSYVYGFSPSLKQWCKFSIDQIEDPRWVENAFEKVILNPAPKSVIKGLVTAHEFPGTAVRDQSELKGKGLVFLLHGTPGTGISSILNLRRLGGGWNMERLTRYK